jgi:ADP-ribose pyrophosphatase YjhB (NUDIX family)
MRWQNPVPVVAVLQPVIREKERGTIDISLLVARRAIEPHKGHWALVGGFMDVGEAAEESAAREFFEETSLKTASMPKVAYTTANGRGQLMMMCIIDKAMHYETYLEGKTCPENYELGLLNKSSPFELAFPIHREAVKRFFNGEFKWRL